MIAAGTFGGCRLKITVVQVMPKNPRQDLALRSPRTVLIKTLSQMHFGPCIHQASTRPAVKAPSWLAGFQHGHIGNAADIDDNPSLGLGTKYAIVKSRHQWCALAPCGDVARSKIGNNVDRSQLCEEGAVIELQRKPKFGAVPYCLAVATNCCDLLGCGFAVGEDRVDCMRIKLRKCIRCKLTAFNFVFAHGIQR